MRKMIFVAIALAASSAAADPFKAGSVRYVSCDGDDANDGLTLATPWKSLRRLNSGLPPGGVALLRRGDVFYGQLRVPSGLSQCRPTVIGAYGEGEPPISAKPQSTIRRCEGLVALTPCAPVPRINTFWIVTFDPHHTRSIFGAKRMSFAADAGFVAHHTVK